MKYITVSLHDARFFARHGVFDIERTAGNEFAVNIEVRYPISDSESIYADNLGDTVSYAELFEIAKSEMAKPRNLLETVAASIGHRIRLHHQYLTKISVCITKITPPIPGFTGEACVEYTDNAD